MAKLKNTFVNNSLTTTGLGVDGKIGNDSIVRPIITISGTNSARVIQVNMSQFINNSVTQNGRPKLHWWTSTSKWNFPIVIAESQTFTLNNGVNLDPTTITNTAILRTSLTDNNHIWKFTITNMLTETPITYYFMCSVQGIVYVDSFVVNTEGVA